MLTREIKKVDKREKIKISEVKVTNIHNRKSNNNIWYNAYVSADMSSEPLVVYQSGVKYKTVPGWVTPRAVYDHYIIHYITGGEGIYTCHGKSYPVKRGDAFLIRPFEEDFSYRASEEKPYTYFWVGFNGTEARRLLNSSGFDEGKLTVEYVGDEEALVSRFRKIVDIHTTSVSDKYALVGLLYQLLSLLMENSEKQDLSKESDYIYNAICYIRMHYSDPNLTVKEVAEYVGINRSHFFRVFTSTRNQSIQDFIISTRCEASKNLLIHTGCPISDIAYQCGYKSPSHYTEMFKKTEGMTPREYRMKMGTFKQKGE